MKLIPLYGKVNGVRNQLAEHAMVDDEDFERLNQYRWKLLKKNCSLTKTSLYAIRSENGAMISMHRSILGTPKGMLTDHIDSNGLNNQKSNLRTATAKQNSEHRKGSSSNSRSGVRGVSWDKSKKKWRAGVGSNNKVVYWSFHDSIEEASQAAEAKRKELGFLGEKEKAPNPTRDRGLRI